MTTVLQSSWGAVLAALQANATLTDVQVLSHPPAENQALKESVWFMGQESEFEWNSLGANVAAWRRNRTETVRINIALQVYREAPDQFDAATAAIARAQDLVEAIEESIQTSPSIGGSVSFGRVATADIDPPVAAEGGWIVRGRCVIEAENHPT